MCSLGTEIRAHFCTLLSLSREKYLGKLLDSETCVGSTENSALKVIEHN